MMFTSISSRHLLLRVVAACGIYVLANSPSYAGPQDHNIETALGYLLVEHPSILSAEKTQASSRASIDVANSGYFPTVSIIADSGPQNIDTPTTRDQGSDHSRTKHVTTLTVNQNIFDGNLTTSSVRTAQLNTEVSSINLEQVRQNVLFEGITAYIDVLRQKRLVDLGIENVSNIEQQLNLEDERVRRGSGIAVDVLEAKSRLQIGKERLVSFNGALIDAITRYAQIFGRTANPNLMEDPWPPVSLIPTTLDAAIDIALRENPAIGTSNTNIEIARERRRSLSSELYPNLDIEGSANYEKNNDTTIGYRKDYSVLLRASWDLYSGNSTTASMDQAFYDYRASMDNHIFLERKTAEGVRLAWQNLLTTRSRIELLENAVNIAGEVYGSRVKLREAGKETVINVLDAQNQVTSAQINYTSTAYNERLAAYQMLLAMGRLNATKLNLPQP